MLFYKHMTHFASALKEKKILSKKYLDDNGYR